MKQQIGDENRQIQQLIKQLKQQQIHYQLQLFLQLCVQQKRSHHSPQIFIIHNLPFNQSYRQHTSMSSLNASSITQNNLLSSSIMSDIQLKKIKQQNIQLYKQIFQLQKQVSQVLSKHQNKKLKNLQVEKQLTELYGQQLEQQQKKIKKLKQQLYYLKSSNAKLNMEYLNKEQDQLSLLIVQRDQLYRQRQLQKSNIQDKKSVLQKNNGLQTHKKQLQSQYTQTKRINQKRLSQIVQLERQIRKYHYASQTVKNQQSKKDASPTVDPSSLQMQFQQTAHQILKTQREIKEIQTKWKSSIESLDSQFFTLSAQDKGKKQKVQKLLRQFKIIQHRSKSLRDQAQILQDRNRLSKIVTSTSLMGFGESYQKSKSNKDSQVLFDSQRKSKIKSDFIFKELQNIKAKKENKQYAKSKVYNSDPNSNKTVDMIQKKPAPSSKEKSIQLSNRSFTQGQLLSNQKAKQRVKQLSTTKQSELKISERSQEKVVKKQCSKTNHEQSQKIVLNNEKSAMQKASKSIKSNLKLQLSNNPVKQKNRSDSPLNKKQNKQEQLQQKNSSPQSKRKLQQTNEKDENKQVPQITMIQRKISKKSDVSIEKSSSNKIILQSPIKVSEIQKSKNSKKNKDKEDVLIPEKITKIVENKEALKRDRSSQKLVVTKSIQAKSQSKNETSIKKKENKPKTQKYLTPEKTAKLNDKKVEKQLKESISIKQKQIQQTKLQQKTSKKSAKKMEEKIREEPSKQKEKFQIRLQNKVNTKAKQQNIEKVIAISPKQDQIKIQASSKQENQRPQINSSAKIDTAIVFVNSQIKQQPEQVFKPYLIKRKRAGGVLNFQNKQEQSKQKDNLLKLIEKQSIGVGSQRGN